MSSESSFIPSDQFSPGVRPAVRTNRLVTASIYLCLIFILLFSCWLFLSNLDQLVPSEDAQIPDSMSTWTTGPQDNAMRRFAGGFWLRGEFYRSILVTVVSATITMVLSCILGIPCAYALSRYRIPGRRCIDVLLSSIIVLPSSSVGLSMIILFQFTWLFDFQKYTNLHIVYSLPGIIAVQLVLSLAMGIRAWKAAFDDLNPRFELVARTLGSSELRSFFTVTLPCVKTGIAAGCVVAWARAAAEFGGVLIFCSTFAQRPESYFSPLTRALGLNNADPLAVSMWSQIEYGNVEYGFALGFTLVLVSIASVWVIHRLGGKGCQW